VESDISDRIIATPEASAAIARAVAEHGPIMFHTSGGRVGGRHFPICLPADALRIGVRDHLLGVVAGAKVYEMEDRDGAPRCRSSAYVLDVAPGMSFGFSIEAAPGMRFTLKEAGSNACGNGVELNSTSCKACAIDE
jgi:uncharacterized protein (DUF779 family)